MVKEIVWTHRATKTFWQIIAYLNTEFGEAIVAEFVHTVHKKVELIASNPYLFRKSEKKKNVFVTTFHKRTQLFYRYRPFKKRIELLLFWNTRANSAKLKF